MTIKKAVNFPSPGRVFRSTTDLLYGELTYSSHLRKGSMRVTSNYQDGASGDGVLSIWSLGNVCSVHDFKGYYRYSPWEGEMKILTAGDFEESVAS